ncbi:MAG: hypothetical protein JWR05_3484 [Mucilaginibacter sp.]|nr:hypothetical protein [Mucilaginibacter sp.]
MNYTNGFDTDLVLPALSQRLGWRQPTIAGSPVLTGGNIVSVSGRYFGPGFHALCTINNIKANQEDPAINDTNMNALLAQMQTDMIMRSLTEVFREPELLEQCLMYTRFGMNDQPLPNQGQWAGWCINVANDHSISSQIKMGTFYFDSNVTFNMYLYQDGIRTPLKTIPINVVAWQHTAVDFSDLVLNFKTGQRYYFLYNQAELGSAKAIREQVQTIATTRCFEAYSIQMPPTTDGSVFNINAKQYPALPMGVNLEIISFKDHTQKIIRMANLFDEVQGLQMAAFAMELVNNNTRSNATERLTEQKSQQAFMELNQAFATKEVPVTPGLKSRIMAEFKKLRNTFYPPQCPMSTSMESDCNGLDSYEQNWIKQNASVANNPGVSIQ